MSLAGRRICILVLIIGLGVAAVAPAQAVLPPPIRLALMFDLQPWGEREVGPMPPGHVVIEWSRDGSS